MKVKIRLPDNSLKEYESGISAMEVAQDIGEGLARSAVAVKVDGIPKDMSYRIDKDCDLQVLTFKDEEGQEVFRHTSTHLMAQAVTELWPDAKPTIGPVVEEGFYYDFDIDHSFTPDDLKKIEQKMKELVKKDYKIERIEFSKDEAIEEFAKNRYKIELIEEHGDVSAYRQGDFIDLCRGPHLPRTGMIKAFKLTKIAGAYWRGDSKNRQLQRIYGISFPDKKQLKEHLQRIEEAKKRNHRKLGRDLELYDVFEEAPGKPFFFPNGTVLWQEMESFIREELRARDYLEVRTPIILKKDLWLKSGHWDHYKDNMYFVNIDGEDFAVKPMNCPGHTLIFSHRVRSYRELPLRMAEFGMVHRHELSGVLYGLLRVRKFTQDDAHIFCTPGQLEDEIVGCIDLVEKVFCTFEFKYHVELSTRPDDSMGSDEMWDNAESALRNALETKKADYKLNEGDGAFYGPKIDFHIEDCLGRTWQLSTIQVDFSMPERFDLTYMGEDGEDKHRPVMVHRAILGSMERFLGILTEHFAGKFPLWLAPVQVKVISVSEKHEEFARDIQKKLKDAGLRVEVDNRAESIPRKIREAQLQKVPYMLVVGDKEKENGTANVRTRDNVVHGEMDIEKFVAKAKEEVRNRTIS